MVGVLGSLARRDDKRRPTMKSRVDNDAMARVLIVVNGDYKVLCEMGSTEKGWGEVKGEE